MNKPKITIILFGMISGSGVKVGPLFHHNIGKYFHEQGVLHQYYCTGFDDTIQIPKRKVHNVKLNFLIKFCDPLLTFLHTLFPNFPRRLWREYLFDQYLCRKIDFDNTDLILSLKPAIRAVSKKAKKKSIPLVSLATVAHPLFIKEMISKIEARYKVKDKSSSYSLESRIRRLVEIYSNSSLIMPHTSSKFIYSTYIDKGIEESKMVIVKNQLNIDTTTYAPLANQNIEKQNGKLVFLTVATLNLKKGIPLLIEAWINLSREHHINATLNIVGTCDKSTEKALSKLDYKGLDVNFLGFTHEPHKLYQSADVFIASSVSDLGPRTIMEALSCGLPAIASTHCGYADFIDEGVNGFLYDPFDIEKLQQHILWFISNREQIPTMGLKGREEMLKIGSTDFGEELYRECMNLHTERSK